MMSIVEEIQAVAENADKCINFPIGDKLAAFIKQQDESNQTNFVLSGVLIYAAAKIFGRKVDHLEQEINGIAKNFAAVETSDEQQPEKAAKKSRTKKFKISDSVSLEKVSFEEKPIQVLTKVDINKTLATPSRINRLQKMKEFFAKNKSRTGKLVIPKSMLFTNDYVLSNFGSTQIHDYDDNKDIVGSRRDFTSFSYFVNNSTGELQSDISSVNNTQDDDFNTTNQENISDNILSPATPGDRSESPEIWATPPSSPFNVDLEQQHEKNSSLSFNIDEGIELDEAEIANLLLPKPTVKLIDIRITSPSLFLPDLQVNETLIDISVMESSQLDSKPSVENELEQPPIVVSLPAKIGKEAEAKMKNIFMVPLKKLKHRCLFDLPNELFGDLKRKKKDQHMSTALDIVNRQARVFKPIDMMMNNLDIDPDDEPFIGFTKEMQEASLSSISYTPRPNMSFQNSSVRSRSRSPLNDSLRKYSDDSGLETDCSDDAADKNLTDDRIDFDLSENLIESDEPNDSANETSTSENNKNTECETETNITSGGDSCYHSCLSGDSIKTDLSLFFKDIESRNNTIDEREAKDEALEESEERVMQMQQSAMNIAKWKEYLKPILADSEARSKIDMHQYGVEMIRKIGNVNDTVALSDITESGKTPAYFLTMLQLINNRNVEINFGERSMTEPVDLKNIKITLKSNLLHRDKFDEMGQQFTEQEEKKASLKRKHVQTSTPAKRAAIKSANASLSFNITNVSQSMIEEMDDDENFLSQASSGYFSQSSMLSDC